MSKHTVSARKTRRFAILSFFLKIIPHFELIVDNNDVYIMNTDADKDIGDVKAAPKGLL
ncbi:MAG: hypothetical protein LBH28_04190 [Oscillospiraceae bacterium]|jgi:hypothetical protein|nr:hypothetical protein [Oscillospiraceae bacterium]